MKNCTNALEGNKLDFTLQQEVKKLSSASLQHSPETIEELMKIDPETLSMTSMKAHIFNFYNSLLTKWVVLKLRLESLTCSQKQEKEEDHSNASEDSLDPCILQLEKLIETYGEELCFCRHILDLQNKLQHHPG
ncbi:hypothetical protein XU18_0940 [Perkinsela sp. CCAP 1560/4]|nr:hypothetical protein XU18_0940 [Perkinsela sp. CCAP 1560/4]|eukprot:KNH08537.1 hypothetical protein XU18_0940 [Perkinsela sp. CCAP 1560/4]